MIIKTLTIGDLEVNNYLIICEETKDAVLIDAGGDYDATMQEVKRNGANLKYLFHTHGHFDHITGDAELQSKAGVKIYLHKDDKFLADKLKEQLFMYGMPPAEAPEIDEFPEDGQTLKVGNLEFKVIHTPGHSPGGVCYLIGDHLFSGDTLFRDSVGRTDLPGGSYELLRDSIVEKLFVLDDSIKVYPGHGSATTIGHEKQNNPFFGAKVS